MRAFLERLWQRLRRGDDERRPRPENEETIVMAVNMRHPFGGERPDPGTAEEEVYNRVISQIARKGEGVFPRDREDALRLTRAIQEHGHRSPAAKLIAREMGLDGAWLPVRRKVDGTPDW